MGTTVAVVRHLVFERGLATILVRCCPLGRRGNPGVMRYRASDWVAHVQLFRAGGLSEAASCFGNEAVLAWLGEELGDLRLSEMPRFPGETPEACAARWQWTLKRHRLVRDAVAA